MRHAPAPVMRGVHAILMTTGWKPARKKSMRSQQSPPARSQKSPEGISPALITSTPKNY